jgi:hypothetical protein
MDEIIITIIIIIIIIITITTTTIIIIIITFSFIFTDRQINGSTGSKSFHGVLFIFFFNLYIKCL